MTDPPPTNLGFNCGTPGCPARAWEVVRIAHVEGAIRRTRRCLRCGRLMVTFERAAFFGPPDLPLSVYFQPRQ